MNDENVIEVRDLKTHFHTEKGKVTAVDNVSFQVKRGEILGVVGESGCGKSVTSESIMRLLNDSTTNYEGEIRYHDTNLLKATEQQLRNIRGKEISMIFQDPASSLNPLYTVGNQIAEALMRHSKFSKKKAYAMALDMLKATSIPAPEQRLHEYPHELSGGMRQRVMIAMALACNPSLLIADEPTTALDVTTQAQILDLIIDLKNQRNMGVIFITHDIGVVAEVCDRVIVMYLGQVIEDTSVSQLFDKPLHPYTKGLMQAMPTLESDPNQPLHMIDGTVPSLSDIPKGCRFSTRCPYATQQCIDNAPTLEYALSDHKVRCWHWEQIAP
tara:strand:+ start:10339 stop:11322 length:984 start_codon:yes stop_codon:yes gene_type:complete